jgi:hypothetical protein
MLRRVLQPIDITVLRALEHADARWRSFERVVRDSGYDPCKPADRTRVLSVLSYLQRGRQPLVCSCRPADGGLAKVYALTAFGERELATLDQLALA